MARITHSRAGELWQMLPKRLSKSVGIEGVCIVLMVGVLLSRGQTARYFVIAFPSLFLLFCLLMRSYQIA